MNDTEIKTTSKSRILFLLKYLHEKTDDEHEITTEELIGVLAENGFKANRKTVKADIDILIASGYDILTSKVGKFNAFHLGERDFELPELKLLVDAVSSSRFMTLETSDRLISKLTKLTSDYQAKYLTAKIYTADRIKANNRRVFLNIDLIGQAMEAGKKISFQYYSYNPHKEKELRHDGEIYINSPYALIWNDDRYYLVGYSEKREKVISFRIDRIVNLAITDEKLIPDPEFNAVAYANTALKMYSGPEEEITLQCKNDLMQNVVDKFGEDIETEVLDEYTFTAKVTVCVSPTFYSWIFGFAGDIRILAPETARAEYQEMAEKVLHC